MRYLILLLLLASCREEGADITELLTSDGDTLNISLPPDQYYLPNNFRVDKEYINIQGNGSTLILEGLVDAAESPDYDQPRTGHLVLKGNQIRVSNLKLLHINARFTKAPVNQFVGGALVIQAGDDPSSCFVSEVEVNDSYYTPIVIYDSPVLQGFDTVVVTNSSLNNSAGAVRIRGNHESVYVNNITAEVAPSRSIVEESWSSSLGISFSRDHVFQDSNLVLITDCRLSEGDIYLSNPGKAYVRNVQVDGYGKQYKALGYNGGAAFKLYAAARNNTALLLDSFVTKNTATDAYALSIKYSGNLHESLCQNSSLDAPVEYEITNGAFPTNARFVKSEFGARNVFFEKALYDECNFYGDFAFVSGAEHFKTEVRNSRFINSGLSIYLHQLLHFVDCEIDTITVQVSQPTGDITFTDCEIEAIRCNVDCSSIEIQ